MKKDQKIYRITAILFLSLGLLLTFTYRPFIYSNHIYDYGIADTIGSFISVVVFCCLVWSFKLYSSKEKNFQIIVATFIYSILWELLGFFKIWGTFDYKDIIAAMLSGVITFIIKTIVDNKIVSKIS